MFLYYLSRIIKKARGKSIKNSYIHKTSKIESGSQVINTQMDKHSFCGYECKLINCKIGSFCSIADNVTVGLAQHPLTWVSTSPVFYKGRDSVRKKFTTFDRPEEQLTTIGNDVWIGESAMIKAGVSIGNGAVIGMGSVVTKNVGAYEIWAGNPARCIKKRFSEAIISELEKTKWWLLEEDKLQKISISIKEPEEFINKVKGINKK